MVGLTRNRSRFSQPSNSGSYAIRSQPSGLITGFGFVPGDTQTMTDVVGNPLGQNPMTTTISRIVNPLSISGVVVTTPNGLNSVQFSNYPCSHSQSLVVNGPSTPLIGSFRDYTSAIADNMPGDSLVSLPNFLYELKDVPDMLKHAASRAKLLTDKGLSTHRKIRKHFTSGKALGEDWLNYHFGWAPFFSDLSSVLNLSAYADKRKKQYDRAKKNGFLTMRSDLGDASSESFSRSTFWSLGGVFLYGTIHSRQRVRKWVSSRYTLDTVHFPTALPSNDREFLSQAFGLDFELVQLWDAIPWTWLSDWFLNVGNLLKIGKNRYGFRYSSSVLMTNTLYEERLVPDPRNDLTFSGTGIKTREIKSRVVVVPSIIRDGYSNIFSPSHLGTLAALKVTRGSGSSRF